VCTSYLPAVVAKNRCGSAGECIAAPPELKLSAVKKMNVGVADIDTPLTYPAITATFGPPTPVAPCGPVAPEGPDGPAAPSCPVAPAGPVAPVKP